MEIRLLLSFWEYCLIVLWLLSAITTVHFYLKCYRPVPKHVFPAPDGNPQGVSVILSGKNHSESLKQNLVFWLQQDHPCYEVVVVHEKNDEETLFLIEDLRRKFPRLRGVNANQSINFFNEQLFSLSIGVRAARYDHIILTSPLCRPASEKCISLMQAAFRNDTQAVVGLVEPFPLDKAGKSFRCYREIERRMEYIGAALNGQAFTGERSLIAYRKDIFLEHQGYTGCYALDIGNFDLLAMHIENPKRAGVQALPEAAVISQIPSPPSLFRTEREYRNILARKTTKAAMRIRIYHIAESVFWILTVAGCALAGYQLRQDGISRFPSWIPVFLSIGIAKYCIQAYYMQKAGSKLKYGLFWFALPIYGFLYIPLLFAPVTRKKKNKPK